MKRIKKQEKLAQKLDSKEKIEKKLEKKRCSSLAKLLKIVNKKFKKLSENNKI